MKHIGLLILLLTFVSCLPAEQNRELVQEGAQATTAGGSGGVIPSTEDLGWYLNFTTQKRLVFFRDTQDNTYLKGSVIDNFLIRANNPAASYCLELDMGPSISAPDKRFLLARAVPVSVNVPGTGKVLYLRVDFGNPAAGEAACKKDKVQFTSDSNTEFIVYSDVGVTFTPARICSACVGPVTSAAIKVFLVEPTRLVQVRPLELDLSSVSVLLQPGTTPGTGNTCNQASCAAIGFNCCADNQCVKDAQVRNGVTNATPGFEAAQADVRTNPMAYTRYPQFYYICGTVQPGPGTTGGAGNGGTTDADIVRLRAHYKCVQHLKASSSITPYLQSPYTPEVTDQTICNTTLSTSPIFVTTVLKELYASCAGACQGSTLDQLIANCSIKPDYVPLNVDAAGVPGALGCTAFPDDSAPPPPTNTKVSVSSRSVPHRFFNASGAEVDLGVTNPATTTQEGTKFYYNDPLKTFPVNGTFNMNSILGQMTLALDQARPAQVVNVEIDQIYYINTDRLSIYASDCPECSRDAWYLRFSPYPQVSGGNGLRAFNKSTQRDAEDGNTTFGNYEDTIFGRACWVPPTMLPFSQPIGTPLTAEAQRVLRLKTQAAMWINGYRRDWFGFNKGALIGSFDGVSWFAIGKGRIIRSTSNKLFLAINAPFGDLASDTVHSVNVNVFTTGTNASQVDFDPTLSLSHPNQNAAGSCQASHQCTVDSDCITQLGWEYVCADVSQQSTYWSTFTAVGAREEAQTISKPPETIASILAQDSLPGSSTKRCVYRGAGAPCRTDAGSISSTELEKRKLLTCAPNFWCADVDGTNNVVPGTATNVKVFNKEIARFFQPLEEVPTVLNHIFGQDANVLGRPLDYVHTTASANSLINFGDAQIISVLNTNVTSMDPMALNKVGLCRPGKGLPYVDATSTLRAWSPFEQHQQLDQFSRTDYINQIGSCPASFQSIHKTASCPVLDASGNYLHQTTAFDATTALDWGNRAMAQNSCGLETLRNLTAPTTLASYPTADAQQAISPFQLIEGRPLNSRTVATKSLTRDACLRKAGSVCHTDLDCSPNKLHSDQLDLYPVSFFGNEPNRRYYDEFLVCGQGKQKPFASESDFNDYDMKQNRCCREVGSALSTYSAYEPIGTGNSEDLPETVGLDPFLSGAEFPTEPGRYERFASLLDPASTLPGLNAFDERDGFGNLTSVIFGSATSGANIRTPGQWQTLNNANTNTCCGGGWMRKFADDGTTNWPIGKRFNPNINNFRCLNYISPLVGAADPSLWGLTQPQLDADGGRYCTDVTGTNGNCAQLNIQIENNLSASPSCATRDAGAFGAIPTNVSTLPGEVAFSANIFAFFPPVTADGDVTTFIDTSVAGTRQNVSIFMPSYVGDSFTSISMQMRDASNVASELVCDDVDDPAVSTININGPTDVGTCNSGVAPRCCYKYDATTRVLKVALDVAAFSGRAGAKISFNPPGTAGSGGPLAKQACKDYYYLDILGRLELAGVPQITHPRILCNNNSERVVPGLYQVADSDTNKAAFDAATNSFVDAATTDRHVNYTGLDLDPVFDPHEFKCCTPLGKLTKNAATCCSGLGVEFTDPSKPPVVGRPNFRCMLPSGTDLNVYFNRFVSNEGTNTELPSGGLLTSEFNLQTGEPLVTSTVNNKLSAIGNALCNSTAAVKVRRGGAFGNFRPEPLSSTNNTQTVYGIADSTDDTGTINSGGETISVGHPAFRDGFRWNHHTYCK